MISCQIVGRLGNQMFLIATTYSLALDNNATAVFPKTIGGITPTKKETCFHKETILRKIDFTEDMSFIRHVHEEPSDFSFSPIEYKEGLYLIGYFQSEKYFKHNREAILKLFEPQEKLQNQLSEKYCNILKNNKYVSVHIRRGDYLNLSEYHATLGMDYYTAAMQKFSDEHIFVFFSDDIEWCKKNFNNGKNIFIENQEDVLDLYLMSKIPNNIIANSSFSWWSAWLNQNKNKIIISPKKWFGYKNSHLNTKDLIPDEWIKI